MSKITLTETAKVLLAAKSVIIASHINPDGDAIGSSLALMHTMTKLGKDARVFIDDAIPSIFAFLPGAEKIERPPETITEKLRPDLFVILDASLDRVSRVRELVDAPTLNIDHHVSNDGAADKLYLDADRAATAEIIYELVKEMNAEFDYENALPLYTGIATDSGFFRYANTKPFTMRAAAELMEYGVKPNLVSEATEVKPFAVVKGLGAALSAAEIFHDGLAAGIFLDYPTVKELETTEGFIDEIRVIEGVDVAVLVKCQGENMCRVSMRSKTLDVAKIAMKFGGGGHVRAAGCTLKTSFDEAKKIITEELNRALSEEVA